jgi:hypothetical protein
VGEQAALLSSRSVQQKWQMVGVEAIWSIDYKRPKRMVVNDAMELFNSSFFKMLRYVHLFLPADAS